MIVVKDWDGKDLRGDWTFTLKLDGIRALSDGVNVVSRAGKPLFGGLHRHAKLFTDAEVFCGSFKDTVSTVRSHDGVVKRNEIYSLNPLDKRLILTSHLNPTAKQIKAVMKLVNDAGHEGLVLRQGTLCLKVKPVATYDVKVRGWYKGKGKHKGKIGGFVTDMGRVGTGLLDTERESNPLDWIGSTIEVACMGLTENGKFRQPRFIRSRFDK